MYWNKPDLIDPEKQGTNLMKSYAHGALEVCMEADPAWSDRHPGMIDWTDSALKWVGCFHES